MNNTPQTAELRALGWSDRDVASYEELWEYRRRWGAICIEPDEREFLHKADEALKALVPSRVSFNEDVVNKVKHPPKSIPAHDSHKQPPLQSPMAAGVARQGVCFVALDFETADYGRDSACSVALVRVEGDSVVHRVHRLIRPPRPTFAFTRIHGITWAKVADAPSFRELWPELEPVLDGARFIAAHNASFDASVMRACCHRATQDPPAHPYVCTVELARKAWNIHPTKLPDVCRHLNIGLKHHDALSDAEACANIMLAAIRDGKF